VVIDAIIRLVRRKTSEVDDLTTTLDTNEIVPHIADARDWLELLRVPDFDTLVMDVTENSSTYGTITPEPTLEQGHMLALRAAQTILESTYSLGA
jgi:hypothetical protein